MAFSFNVLASRATMFVSRNVFCKKSPDSIFFSKGIENLGDSMVPWIIEKISGRKYPYSNPLEKRGNHLLSIGSILQYATTDCYVWGTGFIDRNCKIKGHPKKISALRGPLTRERLLLLGIEATNVYGDPALLTSKFVTAERIPMEGKVGLIPHYADWETMSSAAFRLDRKFEFIDIRTSDIEGFVKQLLSCELVISSSLHGLIISESFGIPVVWCEISNQVVGRGFKFFDYFSSTGRDVKAASMTDLNNGQFMRFMIPPIKGLEVIQDDLLAAFPENYL